MAYLRQYEVCTGKMVHRFKEDYSSIAFAPSGWQLATGCKADASILTHPRPALGDCSALAPRCTLATPTSELELGGKATRRTQGS